MIRHRGPLKREARTGSVGFFLLLGMPVVLMIIYLGVNSFLLYDAKITNQHAVDAAALAAAQGLADDRLLRQEPSEIDSLMADLRVLAQDYARYNPYGVDLFLDLQQNDVIFGYLEKPNDTNFEGYDPDNPDPALKLRINSVMVRGYRTAERENPIPVLFGPLFLWPYADLISSTTVTLDNYVVGVKNVHSINVPMAPIAIFSDPTGADIKSWEYQVEEENGTDDYQRQPTGGFLDPASDDLYEIKVIVGNGAYLTASPANFNSKVNAAFLRIGTADLPGIDYPALSTQLTDGITKTQLQTFDPVDASFLLDSMTNQLLVPGTLSGPNSMTADFTQLQNSLNALKSSDQPRVWPLYSGISGTNAVVKSFVAARVTDVRVMTDSGVELLTFTLQPCMFTTTTALTDPDRDDIMGERSVLNPYVARVRVVK